MIILTYILFVIGFVFLIKGADLLVDGASAIAKRFGVPAIVIGLTIVAFGTSAPEMVVNILAGINGNPDIAVGNIVGSNIANILLILGITALIYPISVGRGTTWKEIPASLMAAVIVFVLANDVLIGGATTNLISRIDGIILILFFGAFLYYTVNLARKSEALESMPDSLPLGKSILYIVLGLVGLVLGGKWIVDGAVTIAESFGVSQQIIGLTIVAVGTSLPELATSVVAALKKQSDIAVGNIIGSNIFNIFWILGLSAVIVPLPFNTSANFDVLVMIGASLLLFLSLFLGKKGRLDRWQGVVYVLLYIVYVISFVVRI